MKELVLEATTAMMMKAIHHQPAHGLLLTGKEGVGLGSLASKLACDITSHPTDVTIISPEKATIPIERIRLLYEETRSIHTRPHVIIIDDADTLSREAQNALLKLLEEPVDNVHFILTTHSPDALLATVKSRVQVIVVKQLTSAQSETLLDQLELKDARKRSQALFLAHGLPAELTRLAEDEKYFTEQVTFVEDARRIIQGSLYTRLQAVAAYTDRVKALQLLSVMARLMTFSLLKQKQLSVIPGVAALDLVSTRIQANGHVRTQLMYLMTKLP